MRPLLFVNWSAVNARFTALMWTLALVLTLVVLVHMLPSAPGAYPARTIAPHSHAAVGHPR